MDKSTVQFPSVNVNNSQIGHLVMLACHRRTAALAIFSLLALTLHGCGGGGGGSEGSSTLKHSINASWDTGMSASPAVQSVARGKTASFTLSFKPGMGFASVSGCGGGGVISGNTYTTDVINADCVLNFTSKITYTPTSLRLKPAALFADEFANTPVTMEVPTTNATGLKLYAEYFSGYFDRSMTPSVVKVPLFDDGTHGDRIAGDGVHTAMFTIGQSPLLRYHDNTVDSIPISVNAYDASGSYLRAGSTLVTTVDLGIISRAAAVPVETVAADVRSASHVVNVVQSDPADLGAMLRRVYQFYPDTFDGFAAVIVGNTVGHNIPNAGAIRNDIDGINVPRFDNSAEWAGSTTLQHAISLQSDITGRGFLHELGHRWAFFLNSPSFNLTGGSGVHIGTSTVLGQMGNNNSLQQQPGGDYLVTTAQNGDDFTTRRYADLELYLMGLLPPQAVAPEKFVTDQSVNVSPGTLVPASKVTAVTIDDIVRVYGARTPSVVNSQKRFRFMFVVLSTVPATPAEMALVNRVAAYYEGNSAGGVANSDGLFTIRTMHSFRSATRGLGELVTRLPARK